MSDNCISDHSLLLLGRRQALFGISCVAALGGARVATARAPGDRAHYRVRLTKVGSPVLTVEAVVPSDGDRLRMANSYPAELPIMESAGWPALVQALEVTDEQGRQVAVTRHGDQGWRMDRIVRGRLRLRYIVDFAAFRDAGWTSPLESAVMDAHGIALSARALFIWTDAMRDTTVDLQAPPHWHWVTPWRRAGQYYHALTVKDLIDNFVAASDQPTDTFSAGGFAVQSVAMGAWRPLRRLIRHTVRTIVTLQSAMMGHRGLEPYLVILVPPQYVVGQSYRQSVVVTSESATEAARPIWANTLAHEIFHYWNFNRLSGRDYASTQWFQEGATEYVANATLLVGKIMTQSQYLAKIAAHVDLYRQLQTTLENIGTRKGKPLYSAGALVAFGLDATIRRTTRNQASFGTFFRLLWIRSDAGDRKYDWSDIEAALAATAKGDWRSVYDRYIRGNEPLPLKEWLASAGLRIAKTADGKTSVVVDPQASPEARAVFAAMSRRL